MMRKRVLNKMKLKQSRSWTDVRFPLFPDSHSDKASYSSLDNKPNFSTSASKMLEHCYSYIMPLMGFGLLNYLTVGDLSLYSLSYSLSDPKESGVQYGPRNRAQQINFSPDLSHGIGNRSVINTQSSLCVCVS